VEGLSAVWTTSQIDDREAIINEQFNPLIRRAFLSRRETEQKNTVSAYSPINDRLRSARASAP
jgi:hypothetical protein